MGMPKHLLQENGAYWIERTVSILSQRVEQVVIAGAGDLPESLVQVPRVADISGVSGPLAGILAAFRRYPSVSWLVVACDLPDLEGDALQWLLEQRGQGVLVVMPALMDDGQVEPLLAYYGRQSRPLLENMAQTGCWKMNRLRDMPGVITPQPPRVLRRAWCNVNRRDEFEQRQASKG